MCLPFQSHPEDVTESHNWQIKRFENVSSSICVSSIKLRKCSVSINAWDFVAITKPESEHI